MGFRESDSIKTLANKTAGFPVITAVCHIFSFRQFRNPCGKIRCSKD